MELPSKEILGIIYALVPGFLAAWVFYGLTAYPEENAFRAHDSTALIFTLFVQAMTFGVRLGLEHAGHGWLEVMGSVDRKHVAGLVVHQCRGDWHVIRRIFANKDWFHQFLRCTGMTKRTSFPSEWFSAFDGDKRHVILHLKGRRPVAWLAGRVARSTRQWPFRDSRS